MSGPYLTEKRRRFAELYLFDDEHRGQGTQCYELAFPSPSGKRKRETATREAKRLLKNESVQAYMEELKRPLIDAAQCSMAGHLTKLAEIREMALRDKDYLNAYRCERSRGEAAGHYTRSRDGDSDAVGVQAVSAGVIRIPTPFTDQEQWAMAVKVDMQKRRGNGDGGGDHDAGT